MDSYNAYLQALRSVKFESIQSFMSFTDWKWSMSKNDELVFEVPTVDDLKNTVSSLYNGAASTISGKFFSRHSTGGFAVTIHKTVDRGVTVTNRDPDHFAVYIDFNAIR